MLGYLLRTAPVVLRAARRPHPQLISVLERVVRPWELDLNRHMNQAVYAQVMELGRLDWALRSHAWRRWKAGRAHAVVAEQRIVYRRELTLGARYTIDTRARAVEGRLLALRSYMIIDGRVHARGDAKLIFVGDDGVLAGPAVEALCEGLYPAPLAVEDWRVRD
ncbi:MAG: acyl-CoA thioesterase [Myxococcales bacterium]|nr:acyl-CoA thioesterase [Myxococcales bacterium]